MTGEQIQQQANQIETWAVVEIFGHIKLAGFARSEVFGNAVMLRVDVPELPERKREVESHYDASGNWCDRLQKVEETFPAEAGYTRYFGMGSIFSLTPCTEDTARKAVEKMRREAPKLLHIGPSVEALPAPVGTADEDDGDNDPDDNEARYGDD